MLLLAILTLLRLSLFHAIFDDSLIIFAFHYFAIFAFHYFSFSLFFASFAAALLAAFAMIALFFTLCCHAISFAILPDFFQHCCWLFFRLLTRHDAAAGLLLLLPPLILFDAAIAGHWYWFSLRQVAFAAIATLLFSLPLAIAAAALRWLINICHCCFSRLFMLLLITFRYRFDACFHTPTLHIYADFASFIIFSFHYVFTILLCH